MTPSPTLSVVLPNYNHGRLIARALEELLAQSPPPDEIIVIDDASTDDSIAVIERFAARSPSIRCLANEVNRGVIATLARGLAAAQGQFVYFAAADDWVMPGFFALALAALAAHPGLGLFCAEAVLVDGSTGTVLGYRPAVRPLPKSGAVTPEQARSLLRRTDNWILTGSSVFRREAVIAAGGFDPTVGSFADGLMARKIALARGFYFAPHVAAAWAIFSDSVSRTTALDPAHAQAALATVPRWLAADPVFPPWYPRLFQDRWRFASARLALLARPPNRPLLLDMGGMTAIDRAVIGGISALSTGRLARSVMLGWLWLRLRPTTLIGLARTTLARRREHAAVTSVTSE